MAKFEMDTDFIRELAVLLEETGLGEIELADGERKIRVARPMSVAAPAAPVTVAPMATGAGPVTVVPVTVTATADHSAHPGAVKSPMVGTAYLSPEPGKPVFVHVGDKVTAGQTLLIIEAMKVMNEIRAPMAGRIAQILVADAQPVEYGAILMVIE
jgi:acetyl-CoA carboxylase biotin carboxyl carrier protein